MKLFGSFVNKLMKPPDNFEQILWKFLNQRIILEYFQKLFQT